MTRMENRRLARRYPITTSLVFREAGAQEWCQASTLNLSRSGVLFRSDLATLEPGRALEFIVTLPLNGEPSQPQARCSGRVVRIATDDPAGTGARTVAATIDQYALAGRPPP